ncbi:cation:proton antiporter [Candidatus Bathyarchaeota archaeon]|nr:cation:proton antiporter [Candidatus Bathyarchaeota archaeon]
MIDAGRILILVSSTIFLSYVSGIFYSKTKIPDIIWVLGLGILLGPVLGFFEKESFLALSPLMSVVALCIILFDTGINMDLVVLVRSMVKSIGLFLATFVGNILLTGFYLTIVMPEEFNILQAMLLGAMTGGTSTVAIYAVVDGIEKLMPKVESARAILLMESIISDPVCIIVSIAFIRVIKGLELSLLETLAGIVYILVISFLFGFTVGLIWILSLRKLRERRFNYILTVAAIFPIYFMAEQYIGEGGGAVAVMAFGLAMANFKYIMERFGLAGDVSVVILSLDKDRIRQFHEEITFFIKSFFFVYIGLIVELSAKYMLVGLGIVALSAVLRYGVATAVGRLLKFSKEELVLSRFIFANGLPALVMSQLPMIFDPARQFFPHPEIYPDLCMPVVLGTVLYGALVGPLVAKRRLMKHEAEDVDLSPTDTPTGSQA